MANIWPWQTDCSCSPLVDNSFVINENIYQSEMKSKWYTVRNSSTPYRQRYALQDHLWVYSGITKD